MWLEFTLQMAVTGHTAECQMTLIWWLCRNIFVLSSYRYKCQELSERRTSRYVVTCYSRAERVFTSFTDSYQINRGPASSYFQAVSWAFGENDEKHSYISACFLCARHCVTTSNMLSVLAINDSLLFGAYSVASLPWYWLSILDTCFILIIWLIGLTFWFSFLVLMSHMISPSCT